MGKMDYGINGPIKGKVGNVVGSSWRGIPYIKSLPVRKKPPTEGEKINRFIFSMTQQWLQPLAEFLKIGFRDYSPTNTGVNAAKSYLYKNALVKDGFNSRIDPSLMKISHGDLPLSDDIQMELEKGERHLCKLSIRWDTAGTEWGKRMDSRFSPEDQVMVAIYCAESKDVYGTLHGAFRKTGVDEIVMEARPGKTYHVYVAFVSADRSRQSDSIYLGDLERENEGEDESSGLRSGESDRTEISEKAGKAVKNKGAGYEADGQSTKEGQATANDRLTSINHKVQSTKSPPRTTKLSSKPARSIVKKIKPLENKKPPE